MSFRKNDFWGTTYVTIIVAIITIVISITALMGWFFQLPVLTTFRQGLASMKVNTALAMFTAGIALLLSTKHKNKRLSGLLASFVAILGILTLSEYSFHWDAHIDELFFTYRNTVADPYPGRMSIATATLAVLLGISLLFNRVENKKMHLIAEIFAGISFVIALGSLLGHLYNVNELYKISVFKTLSLPTSLSFILLATGIFFSRPDIGFLAPFNKQTTAARTGLRGALIIFSIILILSWLGVQARITGLDKSELSSALLVVIIFTSICFVIWWRTVKLNLSEEERERLFVIQRENETRLNEAQRIAHIGSWELDIATNSLQWSEEIYRIFEMNPAKFKSTYAAFLETIHPEDREKVNQIYINSVKNKMPYQIEHRLLFPDGRIKFVSERCETFYDNDGKPIRSLGTVQDITELKNAEIALAKNEKRFRDLLESSPDAMVIVDEKGVIVMTNKQACVVFGYSKEELLGQPVEMLIPETFRNPHKLHRENYNHHPKARAMGKSRELLAINKQNSQFPVEISLSPLITSEGILVSAAIRDITERRESARALEESYQDIRRLTEHLQNIREEERTRIAREIHDELGQHLTVMMMDLSLLEKSTIRHNEDVSLEKLEELRLLVSEAIVSVRRICSELRPSVLDDLGLDTAMELHLSEFEKRSGIQTRLLLPKTDLELTSQEKTSLFRIFQESLTNIARHSGAKTIIVKLVRSQEGILLEIADDGVGFDEKKVKNKTLGILGMRERAAAIGGKYEIAGIPGKGTTVTVFVPAQSRTVPV